MLLSASGNADVLALFGMSVGTSVAIINYISRIFSPIESLGMEIQAIQSAMAGVKRIDAFLNQPERAIPQERKNTARGDVVLSHVTFGYGEKPVLSDFSMTVKEGEQVTLVGRTGAGKSTVFRLLLGLYQPEEGDITIGGVNVSAIPDHERRACIGCVEQRFSRVPGTVLDQITLSDPAITEEMAQNAAKLAGMDDTIRALPDGYNTICIDGMFSQGEWQLLSIARAAAANPAVLLLDEITAPPDFPPLQTVHERFHSHGFPSFTNCYSNQQQVSCCSNVIASIPANFLSLFSLSSCCLFSCTVCMIAEIVPFCVA